jgi:hypothetical protein
LQQVCAEINGTDNVNGLVSFQLHHWCLPPYLQGFGGNVFRDPPSDVMPTGQDRGRRVAGNGAGPDLLAGGTPLSRQRADRRRRQGIEQRSGG